MTDTLAGCVPHPVCNDAHDLTRSNSRPMLISPNLRAALEYDELARCSTERSSTPGPSLRLSGESLKPEEPLAGLPPPPRPKSSSGSVRRAKSPPASPAPFMAGLGDRPSPHTPSHSHSLSAAAISASLLNPFINPPPRLQYLKAENPPAAFVTERHRPMPDYSPRSSVESHIGESPRRLLHSPVQASSPDSAGSSDARPSFQRHLRYLSSIPKVEKLLVMGKTLAVGKQSDTKTSTRRASDAGLADAEPPDKLGRDVQPMMRQYRKILVKGRSSSGERYMSAPSSPVIYAPEATSDATTRLVSGGEDVISDAVEGDDPGRLFGISPEMGPGSAASRHPTRALISHGRSHSAATSRSNASSESSHEPPSTPHDPRISISSTIYQDSHYSVSFDPPFDSLLPQSGRSNMHSSDRESFIDLASPTFSPRSPEFSVNSASDNWQSHSYHTDTPNIARVSSKPSPPRIVTAVTKPPLPTSPKPDFSRRSPSVQPLSRRTSPSEGPAGEEATPSSSLPPTTNFLNPQERADRVRKNRKLAQVFGQNPGAMEAAAHAQMPAEVGVPAGLLCSHAKLIPVLGGKRKHQRAAVSMSVNTNESPDLSPRAVWPPPDGTKHLTLGARRHSSPFTPDTASFMDDISSTENSDEARRTSAAIEVSSQQGDPYSDWSSQAGDERRGAGLISPTSFIDLSEEELAGDGVSSIITSETPKNERRPIAVTSPSSASIYSFTSVELAEEERRRKREKLAKLHRFLGSRVPTDLVLGQLRIDTEIDLPPVAPVSAIEAPHEMDSEARKVWIRRRRSSSAAELGGKWSDDIDRLKEDLNEREKALNVKRAVKMEKMFGVAPPQTLYHTRAALSNVGVPTAALIPNTGKQSQSSSPLPSPVSRNVNQTAYSRNKVKKSNRPGTADSSEPLMNESNQSGFRFGFSEVYEHYRHSLNSLSDIIDRDDKESLERLHDLIHGGDGYESPLQPFTRKEDSPPATPKAERRRSLPSRTSMSSLSSEFSVCTLVSPEPQETEFQTRRRRAAKLTQFFGVNYRDLMSEILDSIEKGLEEEGGLGTLKPDEVQELLTKLRKLKSKRIG